MGSIRVRPHYRRLHGKRIKIKGHLRCSKSLRRRTYKKRKKKEISSKSTGVISTQTTPDNTKKFRDKLLRAGKKIDLLKDHLKKAELCCKNQEVSPKPTRKPMGIFDELASKLKLPGASPSSTIDLSKYSKMLKIMQPCGAVVNRMIKEGVDHEDIIKFIDDNNKLCDESLKPSTGKSPKKGFEMYEEMLKKGSLCGQIVMKMSMSGKYSREDIFEFIDMYPNKCDQELKKNVPKNLKKKEMTLAEQIAAGTHLRKTETKDKSQKEEVTEDPLIKEMKKSKLFKSKKGGIESNLTQKNKEMEEIKRAY